MTKQVISNTWVENAPADFSQKTLVEDLEIKHIERNGKPAMQIGDMAFQGTTKEHHRIATSGIGSYISAQEIYDKLKAGRYAPAGRPVRIWKVKE